MGASPIVSQYRSLRLRIVTFLVCLCFIVRYFVRFFTAICRFFFFTHVTCVIGAYYLGGNIHFYVIILLPERRPPIIRNTILQNRFLSSVLLLLNLGRRFHTDFI